MDIRASHLNYSVRRYFIDEFHFRYVPLLPAGTNVLDLGGNKTRKRGLFDIEDYNLNVVYLNLSTSKQPDVQADCRQLPFTDSSFDAAICAEVLEHVSEPAAVLRETSRILCHGGTLLATVPFLFPVHADPHDFGRYTDHYWSYVLNESGFENVIIEQQGLFFSVLANFFKLYVNRMYRRPFRNLASWPVGMFQRWALKREQTTGAQEHPFLSGFTTGFGIRATKR